MNAPWVSRLALDRALAASLAANERALVAEARVEAIEARYDALLDKFTALRVAGAVTEPAPAAAPAPGPVAPPDPFHALIAERSGTDLRKRGMMLRQLAADRAAGVSDDDIEAAILGGVQADGVPA